MLQQFRTADHYFDATSRNCLLCRLVVARRGRSKHLEWHVDQGHLHFKTNDGVGPITYAMVWQATSNVDMQWVRISLPALDIVTWTHPHYPHVRIEKYQCRGKTRFAVSSLGENRRLITRSRLPACKEWVRKHITHKVAYAP